MRINVKHKIFLTFFILICVFKSNAENADLIVARDGSGDFNSIQEAINSVPAQNTELIIILIKNGTYEEEIRIDKNNIALVGEDRDCTRIEFYKPYDWDSVYTKVGRAVVNIYADDVILANLTVENTQPDVNIHAFAVYGKNNTRTIIINCNILSNGGDTLSLWNGETGMYYLDKLHLRGAVDLLCPRGWCYAENINFYCTRETQPLWHDGSKNRDQKFVVKNSTFDGITNFRLGRNHLDGAFYLINLQFSVRLIDQPFFLPKSAPGQYKWGKRYYFYNCHRQGSDYEWFSDNLNTAEGSPPSQQITAKWTFSTSEDPWDPEANMPSVLPMAFLPIPADKDSNVVLNPELSWIAGRNAGTHKIYFGKDPSPPYFKDTRKSYFKPGMLQSGTIYYWRIDEANENGLIQGNLWQFRVKEEI
jgi:pectinesterase